MSNFRGRCICKRVRTGSAVIALSVVLNGAALRRVHGEDHLDFKYMWYQEDNDRIRVLSPAILLEKDLSPTLTLKIEGIYNAISGASPTGAPPIKRNGASLPVYATQPYSVYVEDADDNDEHGTATSPITISNYEHENENEFEGGAERGDRAGGGERSLRARGLKYMAIAPRSARRFHAKAGATPTPAPAPSPSPQQPSAQQGQKPAAQQSSQQTQSTTAQQPAQAAPVQESGIPMANVEDERKAINFGLTKTVEDHAVTGGFAYSTESDYESMALSLSDAISFNEKNTTLSLGGAFTHDRVDVFTRKTTENKDTYELFLGLTQVVNPTTLFNVNLTLGHVSGYLDDQYKVVELNGVLVPEHRPDSKEKVILYTSLAHMFKSIGGTAELGYRFYDDTFGIVGNTFTFAWYQKLGRQFVVRPMFRYYQQSAADFYDVNFAGTPDYYSADYRISALRAMSYGAMIIWKPIDSFSLDLAVERYMQSGTDGVTDSDVYPQATIVSAGARLWF